MSNSILKKLTEKRSDGSSTIFEIKEDRPSVPPQSASNGMGMPPFPGGPRGTDVYPIWATAGENVINAEASRKYQPILDMMNQEGRAMQAVQGGTIPTYAEEGTKVGDWVTDEIVDAIAMVESGNKHYKDDGTIITNDQSGAMGKYQWKPTSAANPGYWTDPFDPTDEDAQRKAVFQYLKGIQRKHPDWSPMRVIQAYNSGPGRMSRFMLAKNHPGFKNLHPETVKYEQRIKDAYLANTGKDIEQAFDTSKLKSAGKDAFKLSELDMPNNDGIPGLDAVPNASMFMTGNDQPVPSTVGIDTSGPNTQSLEEQLMHQNLLDKAINVPTFDPSTLTRGDMIAKVAADDLKKRAEYAARYADGDIDPAPEMEWQPSEFSDYGTLVPKAYQKNKAVPERWNPRTQQWEPQAEMPAIMQIPDPASTGRKTTDEGDPFAPIPPVSKDYYEGVMAREGAKHFPNFPGMELMGRESGATGNLWDATKSLAGDVKNQVTSAVTDLNSAIDNYQIEKNRGKEVPAPHMLEESPPAFTRLYGESDLFLNWDEERSAAIQKAWDELDLDGVLDPSKYAFGAQPKTQFDKFVKLPALEAIRLGKEIPTWAVTKLGLGAVKALDSANAFFNRPLDYEAQLAQYVGPPTSWFSEYDEATNAAAEHIKNTAAEMIANGEHKIDVKKKVVEDLGKNVDGDKPDIDADAAEKDGNNASNSDKKTARTFFEKFNDSVGGIFNARELGRMAALYLASRALGYSHGGSLVWAAENYLQRTDAIDEWTRSDKAIATYTPASLAAYRTSGNTADLILQGQPIEWTGATKTFYKRLKNGQIIRSIGREYKKGGSTYYMNEAGQNITKQDWRASPAYFPGSDEFLAASKMYIPRWSKIIEDLRVKEGENYRDDLKSSEATAEEIFHWGAQRGIEYHTMGALLKSAMTDMQNTTQQDGKKPQYLVPFIEAAIIRQKTGDESLFRLPAKTTRTIPLFGKKTTESPFIDGEKFAGLVEEVEMMMRNDDSLEGTENFTGASLVSTYFQAARQEWNELDDKGPKGKDHWNNKAMKGVTNGFYEFVKQDMENMMKKIADRYWLNKQ